MAQNDGWGLFDDAEPSPPEGPNTTGAVEPEPHPPESPEPPSPDSPELSAQEEKNKPPTDLTYLVCRDVNQSYAIPVSMVKEIAVARKLQILPKKKKNVMGVMSIRGQVIPIVEARSIFHDSDERVVEKTDAGRQCVVICEVEGRDFGIYVQSASQVMDIDPGTIKPLAVSQQQSLTKDFLVNRVCTEGGETIMLVELPRLIA